jgi:hypothetical protein
LTIWQDYIFFCFLYFALWILMDMSSMEEDQVVHDATQVVKNNGTWSIMMGLHDVLKNLKQMLVPFKCYHVGEV